MLYSKLSYTNLGSSANLPAHWEGGGKTPTEAAPPESPPPEQGAPAAAMPGASETKEVSEPASESPGPAAPTEQAAETKSATPSVLPETTGPFSPPSQEANVIKELLRKAKEAIQGRKRKKLEKTLQFIRQKGRVTNDEVERHLRVSDSTTTRYLNQLIKEGKIRRVGTAEHARYEPN